MAEVREGRDLRQEGGSGPGAVEPGSPGSQSRAGAGPREPLHPSRLGGWASAELAGVCRGEQRREASGDEVRL